MLKKPRTKHRIEYMKAYLKEYNKLHYADYYKRNKTKLLAKNKRYQNTQKRQEYLKAYRKSEKRKQLESRRRHSTEYKAKRNLLLKSYRKTEQYKLADRLHKYRRRTASISRSSHTLQEWEDLKDKFNHCCAICGRQEPFIGQCYEYLTEDHIMPIVKGGTNFINNIQPLCHHCNSTKRDK